MFSSAIMDYVLPLSGKSNLPPGSGLTCQFFSIGRQCVRMVIMLMTYVHAHFMAAILTILSLYRPILEKIQLSSLILLMEGGRKSRTYVNRA